MPTIPEPSRTSYGLALILHAHLPYVRHPEHEDFLEERWLFEAITESYLPLLERLNRLCDERVPFRLTISFTPTLLAMLSDPLLQGRYLKYLEGLIEFTQREIQRTRWQPAFQRLALFYHHRLTQARQLYEESYHRDLIRPFGQMSRRGCVELMASCATHGFLPLMDVQPVAVYAQIRVGLQAFERAFGHRPSGIWLPECGYAPGYEALLEAQGIRYFVTDAHAILFGSPRPRFGVYAPIQCPNGVLAFGRDLASSKNVWSAQEGYPGHVDYREFYRDAGYELEQDYLRSCLSTDGMRASTGIKYYRITGKTEDKQPYDPDRALEQAAVHAEEFLTQRQKQGISLNRRLARMPIIVSPFDAELFGHWWFEGPDWLELVIRKAQHDSGLSLMTLSDCEAMKQPLQAMQPCMSSWGSGGYHEVWLNGSNDWIYRHLHKMVERMRQLADVHSRAEGWQARALNQMARELLLAQSSDWAFILKAQTHTTYAYQRIHQHVAQFTRLYECLQANRVDESWLATIEAKDNLFPFLDYRIYASSPPA